MASAELAGHRIWLPGVVPGIEWGAYYAEFAAAFGLGIDAAGTNFGTEVVLDTIAESPVVAIEEPVPVYPHSLVWRRGNAHPGLAALRRHLCRLHDAGPADQGQRSLVRAPHARQRSGAVRQESVRPADAVAARSLAADPAQSRGVWRHGAC